MKSAEVWIWIPSTYTWPPPPAKSASRPSSGSTRPLPNLSTCTPTCPCASEGRVILGMPTYPRGLEGLGERWKCVPSALLSEKHRTQRCPRGLGETLHTGAFLGLWPMHSYWALTYNGRQLLPLIININMFFQKDAITLRFAVNSCYLMETDKVQFSLYVHSV